MKNYNEFESREEYLSYMKMLFLKDGMKCMLLSAGVLLLLFVIGAEAVQEITGIPENIYWGVQKMVTVCFGIGATAYAIAFLIEAD